MENKPSEPLILFQYFIETKENANANGLAKLIEIYIYRKQY